MRYLAFPPTPCRWTERALVARCFHQSTGAWFPFFALWLHSLLGDQSLYFPLILLWIPQLRPGRRRYPVIICRRLQGADQHQRQVPFLSLCPKEYNDRKVSPMALQKFQLPAHRSAFHKESCQPRRDQREDPPTKGFLSAPGPYTQGTWYPVGCRQGVMLPERLYCPGQGV